jgi:hypothetical protein
MRPLRFRSTVHHLIVSANWSVILGTRRFGAASPNERLDSFWQFHMAKHTLQI